MQTNRTQTQAGPQAQAAPFGCQGLADPRLSHYWSGGRRDPPPRNLAVVLPLSARGRHWVPGPPLPLLGPRTHPCFPPPACPLVLVKQGPMSPGFSGLLLYPVLRAPCVCLLPPHRGACRAALPCLSSSRGKGPSPGASWRPQGAVCLSYRSIPRGELEAPGGCVSVIRVHPQGRAGGPRGGAVDLSTLCEPG